MTSRASGGGVTDPVRAAEAEWLEHFTSGPTRTRWGSMPLQAGDNAPDMALVDHDGNDRSLSEYWRDTPALIIFWRHFGCSCGVERAQRLRHELEMYGSMGAQVVIVSQGDPERAAAYRRARELETPFLCDPDLRSYTAFGLLEGGVEQVLYDAPEEYWSHSHDVGARLVRQRRDMGRPLVDNPWQLPGEFVVSAGGRVSLAYRYQYCEDFPDPLVLRTAIRRA